jgi:hypothetical protein
LGGAIRLAEIASGGASMQFFKKAVFSGPTSFLALVSRRQAVRLACLAAASLLTGAVAGDGAVDGGDVWDVAG